MIGADEAIRALAKEAVPTDLPKAGQTEQNGQSDSQP
jgi:hypothetical protein